MTNNDQAPRGRFGRFPIWIRDRTDISRPARLLYAVLTTYADGEGLCWPSISTLASHLGVSKRWAMELILELESKGLLTVTRSPGSSNRYQLATREPQFTGEAQFTPSGEVGFTRTTPVELDQETNKASSFSDIPTTPSNTKRAEENQETEVSRRGGRKSQKSAESEKERMFEFISMNREIRDVGMRIAGEKLRRAIDRWIDEEQLTYADIVRHVDDATSWLQGRREMKYKPFLPFFERWLDRWRQEMGSNGHQRQVSWRVLVEQGAGWRAVLTAFRAEHRDAYQKHPSTPEHQAMQRERDVMQAAFQRARS